MKKQLILTLTVVLFATVITQVEAAAPVSPTVAPTVAGGKLDQQINQLKNKIASRVAELNLVEKRGVIGIVTQVEGNKITLTDAAGKTRFVDVDEITKYTTAAKGAFALSKITKGTKISVVGLYNKQSKRILARFVSVASMPTFFSGVITEIDPKNFMVTITSEDQKQTKLDVQTTTKIMTHTKEEGLVKTGFSKLKVNDRIFAAGNPDAKDPTIFETTRFIVLPELPQNPKIMIAPPEPEEAAEVTPATGSGKKLTPIR